MYDDIVWSIEKDDVCMCNLTFFMHLLTFKRAIVPHRIACRWEMMVNDNDVGFDVIRCHRASRLT